MIFWILTKFILSKLYIRILTIKNLHLKTRTPTTLPKLILINKPINNLNKHLSRFVSKLIYSMQRKFSRLIIVLESQERDEFLAPRCRFHRDLRFHYRYPAQISCVSRAIFEEDVCQRSIDSLIRLCVSRVSRWIRPAHVRASVTSVVEGNCRDPILMDNGIIGYGRSSPWGWS